ncbi:hypothetical protein [Ktedonospora formicarum]|uniref:Uncharacterized protein n=1 Tax=Ktedonospora formicarum TaxID=2778364 RepID=A0A8J3MXB0_9CHLR|nr:hypothetical protein [Ktedonospora formicarum]GHO49796.1 hypothetical protein KSX_79590 [Ktedonospora formicarum]
MTARPKPKKEEAGSGERRSTTGGMVGVGERYVPNGAAVKSGLNKSILDAAWSLITLCACKVAEAGGTLVKVASQQTSQVCSGCGVLNLYSEY